MDIKTPDNLEVKYINDDVGYGVFTNKEIKKGEVVEVCYYLKFPTFTQTSVDYLYTNKDGDLHLLALGYGSIYNHSYSPNIGWIIPTANTKSIVFTALSDINIGEELCHNYGKNYWKRKEKKII
jgi:SET domain-containing protein